MKYRNKANDTVIEAIQWDSRDLMEIAWFVGESLLVCNGGVYLLTAKGTQKVYHRDYVIKEANGEFCTCKPDVFEQTYKPFEEE